MSYRVLAVARMVVILLAIAVAQTWAQQYQITRSTVDGGGVMFSTGGSFELSGTIGQPDAGVLSGGEFELSGGFWFPVSADDCNSDGFVDLIDYKDTDECISGPGGGLPLPECNCFDIDGDGDVDLSDVAKFQNQFTGA